MPENEVIMNREDAVWLEHQNRNAREIEVHEAIPAARAVTQGPGTLIAHVDTNKVSREELALIPAPEGTDTFRPVAHIELVNSLEAVLLSRKIRIEREQFAIRSDGSKLFGTFDLSLEGIGMESVGALGFRTANDRSTKLQLIAGLSVIVCDNMLFAGDSIILDRKHTKGLNLLPELMSAIGKYLTRFDKLKAEVADLIDLPLTATEAKALIHDAFIEGIMPGHFMGDVSHEYFNPSFPEFPPGTAWALHNAFTFIMKQMALSRRMEAVQGLGKLFGLGN